MSKIFNKLLLSLVFLVLVIPAIAGDNFNILDNTAITVSGGSITNTPISGSTGSFTDLTVSGNTILGDASGDTLTRNAATITIGASPWTQTQAAGTLSNGAFSLLGSDAKTYTGSADGTASGVGKFSYTQILGSNNVATARDLQSRITHSGSGTITNATAQYEDISVESTGSITSAAGFSSGPLLSSSGNITTFSGYQVNAPSFTSTGAITTNIGFTVADIGHATKVTYSTAFNCAAQTSSLSLNTCYRGQNAAGANKYNLYLDGTANNYMAGSLGIGITALTQFGLRVSKNITGATTSFGIRNDGVVQSDVTAAAYYYSTNVGTQATSFTLPELRHYHAGQSTIGAGSSVTSQYGFIVDSSLTGATNNYGFYGNIASGTGRYNLYMNGTADNYLAGKLGIGSTPSAGQVLNLATTITGSVSARVVRSVNTIASDVTTDYIGFIDNPSTQAAAFTLGNKTGFVAGQGTIGSGSAITTQIGFWANSTLTGATTNIGFYTDIAAATGRWGYYEAGTANNAFAGNSSFGTTTAPTVTVNVSGTLGYANKVAASSTAPTISSGFGTTPSIAANNGTTAFTVNVGTGGTASSGVVGMPTASTGWICHVNNVTAKAANRADQGTFQTATSTTSVTIQNQTVSTGAALAWTASDIIQLSCSGY